MPDLTREQRVLYVRNAFISYLFDLIVAGLLFIPALISFLVKPFERPFELDDKSIANPYSQSETCPVWLLVVLLEGKQYSLSLYHFLCSC